jgi:hypothetical protein
MGIFRRNVPIHYIRVHPDNIAKKDWIILLEAGTIVGPSAEKLRVALATLEKKIVTKYNIFLKPEHFLVLEGYDPRIHALYYCPQLTSMTAIRSWCLWRVKRSENWSQKRSRMASWRSSRGMRPRKCCHTSLSSMERWTSILTVWSLTPKHHCRPLLDKYTPQSERFRAGERTLCGRDHTSSGQGTMVDFTVFIAIASLTARETPSASKG